MARFLPGLLLGLAFAAFGEEIWLAPGGSVMLVDTISPATRVVLTAPPDAPLNLSALLGADPRGGIHALVTRMQLEQARGVTANPDGSYSLSRGALPAPSPGATVIDSGMIVYDAGRFTVHPGKPAAGAAPPPVASAAPPPVAAAAGGQALISKPGATRELAERDIRQCSVYAQGASAKFVTSGYRISIYNMAMAYCLRGLGYEIRAPGG